MKGHAYRVPEVEQSAQEQLSEADQKWNHSSDMRDSNTQYSPQPPQSQDLKAFNPETVQKLLEEINSCIALLED